MSHDATSAPTETAITTAPAANAGASAATSVVVDNFSYKPKELVVSVGAKVTWQNHDDVPHTVTSKDGPAAFDSGAMDTDDRFSFIFTKPGTYTYFCKIHPMMTGTVVVK
ncbi:MAG: cupredoxin family copper-binding protein [Planctomycetota bacterium]|nr:cupredoxin family copper-binding protein [Planctomycetota bacterium]